jgi:hypothetical protein
VLEAQRDLIDAGVREITAVTSYNISLGELDYAKGIMLEKNGVKNKGYGTKNKVLEYKVESP